MNGTNELVFVPGGPFQINVNKHPFVNYEKNSEFGAWGLHFQTFYSRKYFPAVTVPEGCTNFFMLVQYLSIRPVHNNTVRLLAYYAAAGATKKNVFWNIGTSSMGFLTWTKVWSFCSDLTTACGTSLSSIESSTSLSSPASSFGSVLTVKSRSIVPHRVVSIRGTELEIGPGKKLSFSVGVKQRYVLSVTSAGKLLK